MDIKLTTTKSELDKLMRAEAERVDKLLVRTLQYLGELCIRRVRDRDGNASWYDQTGNLRSSVGYVLVRNGRIISISDFNKVKDGSEGSKTGEDLAKELAKDYTSGYALIVVAGMNYASFVESLDNKDVLASTELWAESEAPRMMEKLKRQIAIR